MRHSEQAQRKMPGQNFSGPGRTSFPIPNAQPQSPSLEANVTIMNSVYRFSTMFFVQGNFLK